MAKTDKKETHQEMR